MATCVIEDTGLPSIYCQRTNPMEQASPCKAVQQRCQLRSLAGAFAVDSTCVRAEMENTKRRQLHRSYTYSSHDDVRQIPTDSSCGAQAVSNTNRQISITRPTTLFPNPATPVFRSCLSHPAASSDFFFSPIVGNDLPAVKFSSLPALGSPPAKRLRPQNLNLPTPTTTTTTQQSVSSPSAIDLIDSSMLAAAIQSNRQIVIFDCGSPLRHNENRIHQSILLRVSDKISRKRLKSNPAKHSPVDVQQLTDCQSIVLYDDHNNSDGDLSAGIKCACEEIQRFLAAKPLPILILQGSFEQFSTLHPNLCEASRTVAPTCEQPLPTTAGQIDVVTGPMTHILDGLYIGSESNAQNLEELSAENIRHIVNVTSHVPLYHSDSERFHYCHISADDTQKQNLLEHFERAYAFISQALSKREKVLVHCVAGISRSPAIVISFLMRYARLSMNDAYELVKSKRTIVAPNLNFMGQLLQYEERLKERNGGSTPADE